MSSQLQQALSAIQAGDKTTGQNLITRILIEDPNNEEAWLLLSEINSEDRLYSLEQVLRINPNNENARRRLLALEDQESTESRPTQSPQPSREPLNSNAGHSLLNGDHGERSDVAGAEPVSTPEDFIFSKDDHQPQKSFTPSLDRWEHLFKSEREVIEQFNSIVEELLRICQHSDVDLEKPKSDLDFAKRIFEQAQEDRKGSNAFLAPAVRAAAVIGEAMLDGENHEETFWVANTFSEMCKILLARNRTKYESFSERLLVVGLEAIRRSWLLGASDHIDAEQESEATILRERLFKVAEHSQWTFFHNSSGEFRRNWRPDEAMAERVVNETVAAHFDARLRFLLRHDRPKVREFVTSSMPAIYKLELAEGWSGKRAEWEELLTNAGYEDVIRLLRDMGDLISIDELGQLSPERLEDVKRALNNNDLKRVRGLLEESSNEIKTYLYSEAQNRLEYREPPRVITQEKSLIWKFKKAHSLAATKDPDRLQKALGLFQDLWQRDIANLKLRDWVAYLQARTGNLPAAEQMLTQIRKRRDDKHNFTTDWNLAVLAYDRKDERDAYNYLLPLLAKEGVDEDLVIVLLALSLKLGDSDRFLTIIPRTLSLRFHPLAIVVACDTSQESQAQEFLADFLRQTDWHLPPVSKHIDGYQALDQVVNRAIVEGQLDQVITWLEARINLSKSWVAQYLVLARVLEQERQDIDGAFKVLRGCLHLRKQDQYRLDEGYRDLLELSKRSDRDDLGRKTFQMASRAGVSMTLLDSFNKWRPESLDEPEVSDLPEPTPQIPGTRDLPLVAPLSDPDLAERLVWVTARLSNVRSVDSYTREIQAIRQFSGVLQEISPQESGRAAELVQNISNVIEAFSQTTPGDHDSRQVLYDRATGFEDRLKQLLKSGALTSRLADVLTPYQVALHRVMGDLSRQAGVGPLIQVGVENTFVSSETERSTIVLRVKNESERPATDVWIELMVEDATVTVTGKRDRKIASLDPHQSELLSFPIELHKRTETADAMVVDISVIASAEGFPNVDLGITKRRIAFKAIAEIIGFEEIPKLFQSGKPLIPSEPDLFQGRTDILKKIKNSFFGGVQRERYFLDGIRRAGKTSILNFLPLHLPDHVVPVHVNLDKFALQGPIDSGAVLRQICSLTCNSVAEFAEGTMPELLPELDLFKKAPGECFDNFLSAFQRLLPGRIPFLMIDEFQDLLKSVAQSGSGQE